MQASYFNRKLITQRSYFLVFILLIGLYSFPTIQSRQLYSDYWAQAEDIVAHMTLDEKIGQMTQADIGSLNKNGYTDAKVIDDFKLGSVLVGGDSCPDQYGNIRIEIIGQDYHGATMENWQRLMGKLNDQKVVVQGRWEIGIMAGTDSVHGNQHVLGEVLFPHNIGLAATHNKKNFANAAYWTAKSTLESGFNYIFAPCVAVSHNAQWSRYYESLGWDQNLIHDYAYTFVKNAQQKDSNIYVGTATSAKHFLGDGATLEGIDEGNTRVYDFESFYEKNIQGYRGAIEAGVSTIMISYSSILGYPMAINTPILTDKLKRELGFDGFIISDYDELSKIAEQGLPTQRFTMHRDDAVCYIINSGIDMMMLPVYIPGIIKMYQDQVKECLRIGDMHIERIDDAAKRVIAVKLAFGLIKDRHLQPDYFRPGFIIKSKSTPYLDALKAAQESLVLLRNDLQPNGKELLPVNPFNIEYVIFIGERTIEEDFKNRQHGQIFTDRTKAVYQDFDNIGAQCGGWTIRWQGFEGNRMWTGALKEQSMASSILDGIERYIPHATKLYVKYTDPFNLDLVEQERQNFHSQLSQMRQYINSENTLIIGAIAESPYAEFMGDVNTRFCRGTTEFVEGCLYNLHQSPHQPRMQRTTLAVDYSEFDKEILDNFDDIPLISVLIAGRPMLIDHPLWHSEAFIQSWLPGTAGGDAIASAITGSYRFGSTSGANRLPAPWPSSMESLQNYPVYTIQGGIPELENPLFDMGYGLFTYEPWYKFW